MPVGIILAAPQLIPCIVFIVPVGSLSNTAQFGPGNSICGIFHPGRITKSGTTVFDVHGHTETQGGIGHGGDIKTGRIEIGKFIVIVIACDLCFPGFTATRGPVDLWRDRGTILPGGIGTTRIPGTIITFKILQVRETADQGQVIDCTADGIVLIIGISCKGRPDLDGMIATRGKIGCGCKRIL